METFRDEYVLGASCKTEQVGAEWDIWHLPNADFAPIFSSDTFMAIKTYEVANRGATLYPPSLGEQPERQIVSIEETFRQRPDRPAPRRRAQPGYAASRRGGRPRQPAPQRTDDP